MEIKLTVMFDEKTHETLNKLAKAISGSDHFKVAENAAKKPEIKPVEATKPAVEETPTPVEKTADKPTVAAVASDKDDTPPFDVDPETGEVLENVEKIDAETLRALAADVKKKKGSAAPIKALLAKYGAENITAVTKLDPKQVQAFRGELKGLL